MTILERIAALPEISPHTIRENFTFEELLAELQMVVYEKQAEPDYDALFSLFNDVDELMEGNRYNIFRERLFFKTAFLSNAYDINYLLINAILSSIPLIQLDMILEDFLKDNDLYLYMKDMYKEFKSDQIMNMDRVLESLENLNFENIITELNQEVNSLKEIAQ